MRRTAFLQQVLAFGLTPLSACWSRPSAGKPPSQGGAALGASLGKGGSDPVFFAALWRIRACLRRFRQKNPNF